MYNFRTFLQELSKSSDIKFSILEDDNTVIYESDLMPADSELTSFFLYLGRDKVTCYIQKDMEVCSSLLKYTIENKFRELFSIREQFVIDVLEGKEVTVDKIEKSLPSISIGCQVVVVSVEGEVELG